MLIHIHNWRHGESCIRIIFFCILMFGVGWHPPHFDPGCSWNRWSQMFIESLLHDKIRFVNHASYDVAAVLFILKGDMPLVRWNIMEKFSLLVTLIKADWCKWNRILRPSLSFIKSCSKFKVTQNSLSCEIIASAETVGGGWISLWIDCWKLNYFGFKLCGVQSLAIVQVFLVIINTSILL